MRLDKYLKVARIIKRRQVAKELADNDRIFVNQRLAKASTTVKPEDEIKLVFGTKIITVKVVAIAAQANKESAQQLFEVILEERIND